VSTLQKVEVWVEEWGVRTGHTKKDSFFFGRDWLVSQTGALGNLSQGHIRICQTCVVSRNPQPSPANGCSPMAFESETIGRKGVEAFPDIPFRQLFSPARCAPQFTILDQYHPLRISTCTIYNLATASVLSLLNLVG